MPLELGDVMFGFFPIVTSFQSWVGWTAILHLIPHGGSQLTLLAEKPWISSSHGQQAAGDPATASPRGLQDGNLDGSCGSRSVTASSKALTCPTGLNPQSLKVPARLSCGTACAFLFWGKCQVYHVG